MSRGRVSALPSRFLGRFVEQADDVRVAGRLVARVAPPCAVEVDRLVGVEVVLADDLSAELFALLPEDELPLHRADPTAGRA